MDRTPSTSRRALVPAVLAPVALVGGWTLAAALQPAFDPVGETISALAATHARAPWVMGGALAVTGIAHMATALAVRRVRTPGRVVHAVGGAGTLAVALLPVDVAPAAHGAAAAVAFGALSLWPALAGRPGERGVLSVAVQRSAAGALVALLGVFVLALQDVGPFDASVTGLTERLLAAAQALWPAVVVLGTREA
ncbi:DUF998 domain-containing protein [Actinotalea sp. AC32]|nr:DUF998 domain-containing protein [Actinotalea sp. AC32]